MSWLSELFHPGKPYKKAGQAETQGYNQAQGFLQPYAQHGNDMFGQLQQYMQTLSNPQELESQWSQGYETSPYAKQMQSEAQAGGLDAASSMGLMGSNAALSNIQKGSANIMQADRQQYMNDLMQKYLSGLGLGESVYQTGANASTQQGQNAMTHGQNQAQLKFGQQQAGPSMLGTMGSGALNLIMQYLTGGMGQGGMGRGSLTPSGY